MNYNLFAGVVSLIAGTLIFVTGDNGTGAVFVGVGAVFITLAKKQDGKSPK